jgi:hypothetical protein
LRRLDYEEIGNGLAEGRRRYEAAEAAWRVGMVGPSQLLAEASEINELIPGVVPVSQLGTISGPKNHLKTKIGMDLCISLATGTKFLNYFPVAKPVPTGFIAGEDSPQDVWEAIQRISRAKGIDPRSLDGLLFVTTAVPRLRSEEWMTDMEEFIACNGLKMLFTEAGYLGLGGPDQRSLQAMGNALAPIKQLCDNTGCTNLLAAHHKYACSKGWPMLGDIAGVGYEELARFWFPINSRRAWDPATGQHYLRLVVGNKRGEHRYHLDVREGHVDDPGGRVWEPRVTLPGDDAAQELQGRSHRKTGTGKQLDGYKKAALNLLEKHPDGLTKTALGEGAGIPEKQRDKVIQALLDSGEIEECEIKISNQKTTRPGYRLSRPT